jgi:hypothetical protein
MTFGALGIAILAVMIRASLINLLQHLGELIQANDAEAVQKFRRVHSSLLLLNFALLIVLLWSITRLKL